MTTNHTKCNQKQPEVSTFCNLTKQWKKGELELGKYYIKTIYGGVVEDTHIRTKVGRVWNNYQNDEIIEVLAPVPSYEEWQEEQKSLKVLAEAYCKEKEESQRLKRSLYNLDALKCAKCGMYHKRNFVCWNCGYDYTKPEEDLDD